VKCLLFCVLFWWAFAPTHCTAFNASNAFQLLTNIITNETGMDKILKNPINESGGKGTMFRRRSWVEPIADEVRPVYIARFVIDDDKSKSQVEVSS
jgi:hypothetical protein